MSAVTPLAIVVVNFGSSDLLQVNLVALGRATDASIVVVDNFSSAVERDRITTLAAAEGWTLVPLDGNEGFGGGMNRGAERAFSLGCDILLLLNPDATLTADAVAAIADRLRLDPTTAVAPTIRRPDGRVYFAGADLHLADGRIRSIARRGTGVEHITWLTGACLGISRDLWTRIGGFDEDYFLYWEDVDLSWRILEAGGSLRVLDDVVAVHDEGGTHRSSSDRPEAKSGVYYYYNVRNRQLFAAKHLDAARARAWRRNDVRVAYEVLLQGGRRQFLTSLRPLTHAARGWWDGRRLRAGRAIGGSSA